MPAFFIIAAIAGALTVGSTAAGVSPKANQAHRPPSTERPAAAITAAPSFDANSYTSVSDCLTAAARVGAQLGGGALAYILDWWISRGEAGGAPLVDGLNLPSSLLRLLVKMPDDLPPAPHGKLRFISDPELRARGL